MLQITLNSGDWLILICLILIMASGILGVWKEILKKQNKKFSNDIEDRFSSKEFYHSEHLEKADETWEIYSDDNGNVIYCYMKNGEYIIFKNLVDFILYVYNGVICIDMIYLNENKELDVDKNYDWDYLKEKLNSQVP